MSSLKGDTSREFDEDWEDLSDEQEETTPRSSSLPPTSPKSPRQFSSRKRKNVPRNNPSSRNTSSARRTAARPGRGREFPTDEWIEGVWDFTKFTLRYVVDVVLGGIHLLRRPLSFLLFLWLLALIVSRITATVKMVIRPLCIIPGISSSTLCQTDPSGFKLPKHKGTSESAPQWADYPGLINAQSLTFEKLLDESMGGSKLSLDIKKAEMATSDLVGLVKFSKLTSKDLLAESLTGFVEDARRTGRGLQRLGAKVGGAVDSILAVNDYAVNAIAAAQASSPSLFQSLIPFRSGPSTNEIVLRTFVDAMSVLSNTIEKLIVEAEVQLLNLEQLEERLVVLNEQISREDSSISSAKSELLSELWTILGGNRKTLRRYDSHLKLLNGLGEYRKRALAHVVFALQTLRALSDEMEDIRERVSEPELAGSQIPVEVHMKSIQHGLQRLKDSRVKAKEREEEALKSVLGAEHFAALEG
ncbi:hypothetical protein GYMLUDRAFT_48098 [Collybiopsis luxurians FD-317 M1]|uniref:Uncharacterized protein n=1 Tax=Collybiopsis luxurians FD-317 M1 TaxID=944289 RepID=A0A0D0BKA6_9AGAR|nr:hypothetical protein GYMLUDRAFT_48098 [Collybiopsis luxurians FD-317 M1]